ncbi:MAG TPA: DNA (cytosine-5-)-methyltransferase [Acidimicrobiales bacterium]|nr:DNA (cytosine-5-)-methyltransferase [Acidimicrobiales bacterium]
MPRNVLIRNIPDDDTNWLDSSTPPGMSREGFVRQIIADARLASVSPPESDTTPESGNFTFIDLFAGIGGFYMGLAANGGKCLFSNEWDKHAVATYRAWTGSSHVNCDDIRLLDYARMIPDHEVLTAGFPCQPFSIAGVSKKNALGRAHGFRDVEQGNLFFAICDVARVKRPLVMILENVKNLHSHDKGKTWKVIVEAVDALGYDMVDKVIDARAWVPQHRERIFMVCFNRDEFTQDEISSFKFPRAPKRERILSEILEPEPPNEKYMLTDGLWRYLQEYAAKHKAKGNGFGYSLVDGSGVARTLSARYYKDGSEILIRQSGWRNPRRLTPSEAARLMGFNSRYSKSLGLGKSFPQVVSDMQAYKQFGNSVSPIVVEAVGREVLKVLERRQSRMG